MLTPPVIHRDLKPANVIISTSRIAKLADYGCGRICKAFAAEKAERATWKKPVGTSGYMAPDLFDCKTGFTHNLTADLFSFGALMYFVMTGGESPPTNTSWEPEDHLNDWEELQKAIDELKQAPWCDIARRLIHKSPRVRPMHGEIRKHQFFCDLKLPNFQQGQQGANAVRQWLKRFE